jgi:ADP-L-glycero-D-manno-heptose 6-epimerase
MKESWIVVTGAAGFIGSCVVRHLNDLGYTDLILVDDLDTTDKWKNLLGKQYRYWVSKEGIWDWIIGREKKIAAWIHLGACSDTLETNGSYLIENNYRYSCRLAELALSHGHRFIYASSAATYGDGKEGFSDDHDNLKKLAPLNLYGFSKHIFDLWVQKHGMLDRVVGLKYFNIFGPNENHKGRMASMVYKMVPVVQQEGVVRLFKSTDPERFADGEQCRDFLYVKDAVRLTCSFLNNDVHGIFNVGRGRASSWNQLAEAIFRALHLPPKIEYVDIPPPLASQYQNYTCAEMKKWPELEYSFSLEEAVRDYVQQHLLEDERW